MGAEAVLLEGVVVVVVVGGLEELGGLMIFAGQSVEVVSEDGVGCIHYWSGWIRRNWLVGFMHYTG